MQEKKGQIVEAAIRVFARKGLERGKIADIAREAGIGKGTVYEYFRSKEEIFSAIEVSVMGEMMNELRRLAGAELAADEKLQAVMMGSLDAVMGMGDAVLIVTELWAQGARGLWHDPGESALAKIYDDMRNYVKVLLQEGIDAGLFRSMNKDGVATLLMAFLDGLMWQFMLLKDEQKFNQVRSEAIQSFMKGIEK